MIGKAQIGKPRAALITNSYPTLTNPIYKAGLSAEVEGHGRIKAAVRGYVVSSGNRLQARLFQPLLHVAILQRHQHFVHLALNE